MATYVCPVDPVSVWVPLDPTVTELPLAPTPSTNLNPVPANTYPSAVDPADFLLDEEDYGSVQGQNCVVDDWGLITTAVSTSQDYGGLSTLWDLLPTNSPAVPAEELTTAALYPSYKEYTIQAYPVFTVCDVVTVNKIAAELTIDVITVRTGVTVIKVEKVETLDMPVKTFVSILATGGAIGIAVRTEATISSEYYNTLGMIYGFEVT